VNLNSILLFLKINHGLFFHNLFKIDLSSSGYPHFLIAIFGAHSLSAGLLIKILKRYQLANLLGSLLSKK